MSAAKSQKFVTLKIGDQPFALSVFAVRDMLRSQAALPIPLAPAYVKGILNLRGKLTTAFDLAARFNLTHTTEPALMVVVEQEQENAAFYVDAVMDVITVPDQDVQKTADPKWRSMTSGTVQHNGTAFPILDIARTIA